MATISKLSPGQIVYSIERQRMGNTTQSRNACYEIRVIEIDLENEIVLASWNNNPPRKFYSRQIKKWRVKKPVPKGNRFGLPTY